MKKFTAILSVLLILALCLSFAACGEKSDKSDDKAAEKVTEAATEEPTEATPGVKVGDTFTYSGREITLSEIEDGADETFSESGTPNGKWVTLKFSVGDGDSSFSIDGAGFSIDGTPAADAAGVLASGATAKAGSSLLTTAGMTFKVLFDVPQDAGLDYLHLTVTG